MTDRTRTSVCNMASDFLDSSPIGNINDNFGDAIIFARNYEEAIETVLEEYHWNTIKSRAILNKITSPIALDATDFQTAYALPSDCIAPIDINGRPIEEIHWEVETIANLDAHGNVVSRRKVLWCDDTSATIVLRYQSLVEPRDMSAHLAKACAIELAIRCCVKLTNSTSKMQELGLMYSEATVGTSRRVGGYQVDTRQNRSKPRTQTATPGDKARAGVGL